MLFLLAALGPTSPDALLDDPALARRIQAGDTAAFRRFFERYHGLLLGYLQRRRVPAAVAEDLVQQAFLTIWQRRAELDPNRSIRSFLFTIAHNRALNHFRDTARFVDPETRPPDVDATPAPGPEADAAHALLQDHLQAAVEALPPRRRAVFELCFMQQLTHREAAEVLSISPKTVEHQMGHALKAIRAALAPYR